MKRLFGAGGKSLRRPRSGNKPTRLSRFDNGLSWSGTRPEKDSWLTASIARYAEESSDLPLESGVTWRYVAWSIYFPGFG